MTHHHESNRIGATQTTYSFEESFTCIHVPGGAEKPCCCGKSAQCGSEEDAPYFRHSDTRLSDKYQEKHKRIISNMNLVL
eukprot:6407536-Amphidinium_carterae.1